MRNVDSVFQPVVTKYRERQVMIDGALYVALIYFLFSSWSDRVFGIYGEPRVEEVLKANSTVLADSKAKALRHLSGQHPFV